MSTQAQKTLEDIVNQLGLKFRVYHRERRRVEQDTRLTAQAKAEDLAKLQTAYTGHVHEIGERAKVAKKQLQDAIGPISTSTDPANAGIEELTRWEIQKDRAARRILPRLEKAASDPHELLDVIKDLAGKAVTTKDEALAAALREEYPWLIPDDVWGLQHVEASAMRRVYTETLDQVLAPFIPQAEQQKRQQLAELEKSYQPIAYSLAAAADVATGDDRELVLQEWGGEVVTVEAES